MGRAWGNALGGWRKQTRMANGRFGRGKSGFKARRAAKKKYLKPTISRHNGTTYKTTKSRTLIPGTYLVSTKAYHRGEFRGIANSTHKKNKVILDDLYVMPGHRGTGMSNQLVNRQMRHAKLTGKPIEVTGLRSDGGQKFVQRNSVKGVSVKTREKRSSKDITAAMDFMVGELEAGDHSLKYKKKQTKSLKKARAARANNLKGQKVKR